MFKKLVKYQVLSALIAMLITIVYVQACADSGESRSVFSVAIMIKSLVLIFFNLSFYLMIIEPKSKILLIFSFMGLSVFDLLSMFINNSSIGIIFNNENHKIGFFLLTILNLIIAMICAKKWLGWIKDKEVFYNNVVNGE